MTEELGHWGNSQMILYFNIDCNYKHKLYDSALVIQTGRGEIPYLLIYLFTV